MELCTAIDYVFRMRGKYEQVFFKNFFNTCTFEDGLSHSHVITMIILDLDGPSRMSYISEILNLEKGSFTPVANRLIEYDYVKKLRDEQDKRVYILRLTEKGKRFSEQFRDNHYTYVKTILNQLDEDDQKSFIHSIVEMSRIIDNLNR